MNEMIGLFYRYRPFRRFGSPKGTTCLSGNVRKSLIQTHFARGAFGIQTEGARDGTTHLPISGQLPLQANPQ